MKSEPYPDDAVTSREILPRNFRGLCQTYFSGAWDLMSWESWTKSTREKVKGIMGQCLELEEAAIQLVELALDAG